MTISKWLVAAGCALAMTGAAVAQDWYVGGSAGVNFQTDSDNEGETGAFTTGNLGDGSTLAVAAGTDYGWTTEFDPGFVVSGEVGIRFSNGLRAGVEVSYTDSNVETHTDVTLGGDPIGALDAATLAGSPDPLGVSIADLVADGQGDISSIGVFANAYYDFNSGGRLQPYIGGGIGFADVDVEYAPSGVGIIDDGETKFAYQIKAGATVKVTEQVDAYTEYAFRATDDIETDNVLFPGTLDIENRQNLLMFGLRYTFR
ncbi:MAG: outer membrane beta-barrel protein [Pseudomonadota bacterium]